MYRLSWTVDPVIQRVVSNELAAGFCYVFKDNEGYDGPFEIGQNPPPYMSLDEIFQYYSQNANLRSLDEETLRVIERKIEKMYAELKDPEYEYTFDEFGEYLLYLFMCVARDDYEDFDMERRPLSHIENEDLEYIAERYRRIYRNIIEEIREDGEEDPAEFLGSEEKFVSCRLINTTIFPYMAFCENEADNDFSCVYWDTDFTFYDQPDGGNIILKMKDFAGFVMGSDGQEPVSGSIKERIKW